MDRESLLKLVYERCSYFIAQDRHITMMDFLNYVLAQLEREQVIKLVADTAAKKGQ